MGQAVPVHLNELGCWKFRGKKSSFKGRNFSVVGKITQNPQNLAVTGSIPVWLVGSPKPEIRLLSFGSYASISAEKPAGALIVCCELSPNTLNVAYGVGSDREKSGDRTNIWWRFCA